MMHHAQEVPAQVSRTYSRLRSSFLDRDHVRAAPAAAPMRAVARGNVKWGLPRTRWARTYQRPYKRPYKRTYKRKAFRRRF